MKKRIAIFSNGWGNEYLQEVVTGAYEVARRADTDLFVFVNFSLVNDAEQKVNIGETNIYRLPDLRDFDGAVLMANSFNIHSEIEYTFRKVKEAGIPAVSLEYDHEGVTAINTDNYKGMYDLARHVIKEHGAKRVVFIAGPADHWESNLRLQAVQDVMSENGLSLEKEDILFADWARDLPKKMAGEWIQSHGGLPDAFICANDVMAISVSDFLLDHGFQIPGDVIVTGYDCIMQGQMYSPRIASVSHEWNSMGEKAVRILLDRMDGIEYESSITMGTRFIPAESCGCASALSGPDEKAGYLSREIDSLICDQHFRHFYMATKKAENAADLHNSFEYLFSHEHWMEGENFMLCLDPEFYNIKENDANLRSSGFSEYMDVACCLRKGVLQPQRFLKLRDALFYLSDEEQTPNIYICNPLYNDEKNYGFAILGRNINIVADNYLYIWTRHMNQCLEQTRRNITIAELTRKLTELSVTDTLTGIYNRAGCEKIAYPMLREWHKSGGTGAIMIADIDKMKSINDQYGHANGDLALRTVADVLKQQLPHDWVVSRFGGDEFFVGGKLTENTDLEALRESILQNLALEIEKRRIPFDLNISIGFAKVMPGGVFDPENALREADKFMYSIKKEHHEKMALRQTGAD